MRLEDLLNKPLEPQTVKPDITEFIVEIEEKIEKQPEFVLPEYLINDPEVVGYPDIDLQEAIYAWVLSDLPMGGFTVKDMGAGRGDFYGYSKNKLGSVSYTGFETKKTLTTVGLEKYKDIILLQDDFFNYDMETDYTICIGTLNEDNGIDKWEYFNKTLIHCQKTTKKAIIFILSANMGGLQGFFDYPLHEILSHIPTDIRFTVDYTKLEDIYKLTIHIGGYND